MNGQAALSWLQDRLEMFTRSGRRDKGFVLVSTLLLFVMAGGTVFWLISSTDRTIQSAVHTGDFVESGQLADKAVQDAMYLLNQAPGATLPTAATPRQGGSAEDGSWRWHADAALSGDGGKTVTLNASGTFRDEVTRQVRATAKGLRVGGFKVEADDSITYEAAPSTVFTHTVTGKSVTVQNGIGVSGAFIDGSVGLLGSTLDVAPAAGTTATADVDYYQYGPAAASLSLRGGIRAPAGLSLDTGFIQDRCAGAAPQAWKSSQNGGILTAGNVGCFTSMDFDVPTVIQGTGAFNAYVTGGVTIRENISAVTGTGLNIYTNANADFRTEEASGSSMQLSNVYVYAPQGICKTVTGAPGGFRSLSKNLDFSGSLACMTVRVAGKFSQGKTMDASFPAGKGPIGAAGDGIFDNTIWYLADYQQPAGAAARR